MVLKARPWSLAHRSNQGEARTMMFDMAGSENRDDQIVSIARHIACAEIAAGNERTASLLELPGLVA